MGSSSPGSYLVSLPERLLRSAAAVVGGTSLLISETLFPDVVKESTTYRVMFGSLQRFMIERVAQVEYYPTSKAEQVIDGYIGRKMAGNVLEMAGLVTMRFSPVWVFALAGDAAGGGKVFLDRLALNLKQHGVIKPESEPRDLVDLLEAIQKASSSSATIVDTPPLSRQQLAELAGELRANYGQAFAGSRSVMSRLNLLQSRMERTAQREGLSVEEVGGVMALDLAALGKAGLGTTAAVGQTGVELFGEKILASYERTLDELNSQGASAYLNRYLKPFLAAAAAHFDPDRSTWTQEHLLGESPGKAAGGKATTTGETASDEGVTVDNEAGDTKSTGGAPADKGVSGR